MYRSPSNKAVKEFRSSNLPLIAGTLVALLYVVNIRKSYCLATNHTIVQEAILGVDNVLSDNEFYSATSWTTVPNPNVRPSQGS